jgi:uncharacterized protein (DUF1810 family)
MATNDDGIGAGGHGGARGPGDPHDLQRFVAAQARVYSQVRSELAAGRKRSHWMWFVFPQLRGLGASAMAHRYGIASRAEAEAYLRHALLGARLVECTTLMLDVAEGASAHDVLGSPDDLKFRSSMTLFAAVSPPGSPFAAALDRFFHGRPDPATERLLASA